MRGSTPANWVRECEVRKRNVAPRGRPRRQRDDVAYDYERAVRARDRSASAGLNANVVLPSVHERRPVRRRPIGTFNLVQARSPTMQVLAEPFKQR